MKKVGAVFTFLFFLCAYVFAEAEFDKDMELAILGNAGGQFRVGARYLNGEGVDTDYKQALFWLQKAAAQDHANALYNLGYMYLYGVGIKTDFLKASEYFEKSAKGGFLPAYHILGLMYYDGAGVIQNKDKAYEYLKKAADGGYAPAARMIDNETKSVDPFKKEPSSPKGE